MNACTADTISGTGTWAAAYQIWDGDANLADADCDALSTDPDYPIFVIVLNTSMGHGATAKLMIQRHELGHTIGLGDAPTASCWQEWGYWLPLMNNGTQAATYCTAFPNNYTASYNEALYAAIRSGW